MKYNSNDLKILGEIKSHLEEYDIEYSTEFNNFCINRGLSNQSEIEYVPSRYYPLEMPKFGILGAPKDHFYNLSKKAEDEDNSFKYFIKDFEWNSEFKKEIMKSQILHLAGKTPYRFFARDTEVQIFSNKNVREFETQNCFYGYRSASVNIGLVLKKPKFGFPAGTLLMVMTFGKNFFAKKENYVEVFRVGTLLHCQVVGGASKLFKNFVVKYPTIIIAKKEIFYDRIIYYVDYDHGSGKSVGAMEFTWVRNTRGGFMNIDVATGLVSHRDPMNHGIVMEKISSGEIISVPNSGVKVYEVKIDETEREKAMMYLETQNKLFLY